MVLIRGFILDIDGTLLISTQEHLNAWKIALERYGIRRTDDEILSQFGKPTFVIGRILLGEEKKDLADKIIHEKTQIFLDLIKNMDLFSNVQDVLARLANDGYSIVFASSNYNRVIERMMIAFGWDKISVGYVGTDDIVNPKPDPEMIFKAIEKMQLNPEECVTIGDSVYDIQAGKRAGTRTIGVCSGNACRDVMTAEAPDLIFEQFGELYFHLPLNL
jgi:HAD superfamily hydrolase (TIGR01509 family)